VSSKLWAVPFEIKSPKPNKGQCEEMKTKIMSAVAIRGKTSTRAYWGIPYDPYGAGTYKHSFAMPYFDFSATGDVLIGKAFWDELGGAGAYEELLGIYLAVGDKFTERIRAIFARATPATGGPDNPS
jgi:Type II restriction endonuclease, TdeIII